MNPQYIIWPAPEDTSRGRAVEALNRWGGINAAKCVMLLCVVIGFFPVAALLIAVDSLAFLLVFLGVFVHYSAYWRIGRHLLNILPHKKKLVLTNIKALIELDRAWRTYIDTLTADLRAGEHARRYMKMMEYRFIEQDKRCEKEVQDAMRLLASGKSPYPSF